MSRRVGGFGALLLLLCLSAGCERSSSELLETAQFGVFFGGQVQQLKQIEKQLDADRQKHGFRLTFTQPLPRDVAVTWEISLPGADKGPRPALVGKASARQGERVLDVPLAFRPSDPLGTWHAKVSADGRVVIDRDFDVVAP